jgi:hypothetical protein
VQSLPLGHHELKAWQTGGVHVRVFKSIDALEDHLIEALKTLEGDATTVGSIVSWPWIISALLTLAMN